MYQKEWQGIRFSDFTLMSSMQLAGASFYDDFYRALFTRYKDFEELDQDWRTSKRRVANFIVDRIGDKQRVLSIGCGLGYIEQSVQQMTGDRIELSVQDVAPTALKWLSAKISVERIHIGLPLDCLPEDARYDVIYMSAVDYALDDNALIRLLTDLGYRLNREGEILMISASFDDTAGMVQPLLNRLINFAKYLLEQLGLYDRGQLWGWMRSREEYRELMQQAGFKEIEDGFVQADSRKDYWISGRVSR